MVLFDLSGCGKSEGKEEDSNLLKQSKDLKAIINYVHANYGGDTYIIAHSFGTFVTARLSPDNIQKIIFVAMANKDTSGNSIKDRIRSRGGTVDEKGTSLYPRTSGGIQKIGSSFWLELARFDPIAEVRKLASKTSLTIIEPNQDEIVKRENREGYDEIQNLHYIRLDGSHDFADPEQRKTLIQHVSSILTA